MELQDGALNPALPKARNQVIRLRHEGIEQELEPKGFANLRELIDDWGLAPDTGDRLVVAVHVDREPLSDEQLDRLEALSVDGACRIEIESRSRRGLALESLGGCCSHCAGIREAMLEVVEQLRIGRVGEANQGLAQIAESLGLMTTALGAISVALASDASELPAFGDALIPWLHALTDAQAAEDWVRVADCLEFEIGPLLEQWQSLLAGTVETLASENGRAPREEGQ